MNKYHEVIEDLVSLLQAHASGLGVLSANICEATIGAPARPPFIYIYAEPSTAENTNSGVPWRQWLDIQLLVGVKIEKSLPKTLAANLEIVGRIMTVLENQGYYFDQSYLKVEPPQENTDTLLTIVVCQKDYEPYEDLLT